jgi:hypothetical protein
VLYERDVPAREIYHFGDKFLNGYTPQKMQTVRGYFDRVFEGNYAKGIPEGKKAAIVSETDERYTEETGQPPNREALLWKTLRNIETSERFPDLWNQFRDDLNAGGISKTVISEPRDPRDNVLSNPTDAGPSVPEHTGHGRPEAVDTESKGFDLDAAPRGPSDTGHRDGETPAVTSVFEYSTHKKNYEKAYGPVPTDHQVHHLAPQAVFRDSDLAREWARRKTMGVHDAENLIALPQNEEAYGDSDVKIQHSGSHPKWSRYARGVLREKQNELIQRYGSLDKVPNDVMKKTQDSIMNKLREDLLDKDLGLEKGWIIPKESGMDKLSKSKLPDQVG